MYPDCYVLFLHNQLRERLEDGEERRPLSEASSYGGEGGSVRYREKRANHKQQRPLTRYLPVKANQADSDQFNLRQHIESAGHQIELCPSILLTPTTCRGYLHKMAGSAKNKMAAASNKNKMAANDAAAAYGSSPNTAIHGVNTGYSSLRSSGRLFGMRGWNKRWFVFDRNEKALIYYSDKSEGKPRGWIDFEEIEEVYVDHLYSSSNGNAKSPASVAFCVKTRYRTLQLLAPSPSAMRIWVEVIFTGAEGYNSYDDWQQ